jgi:hypothetical protein
MIFVNCNDNSSVVRVYFKKILMIIFRSISDNSIITNITRIPSNMPMVWDRSLSFWKENNAMWYLITVKIIINFKQLYS